MRRGFSLVEVIIATVVFVLAAIPIYYALSEGAAREVDATKLAMARKILESARTEVLNKGFEKLKSSMTITKTYTDLPTGFFTSAYEEVLKTQRKYKDFEFTAQVRDSATSGSVLPVKVTETWTTNTNQKHVPEELTFLLVEP